MGYRSTIQIVLIIISIVIIVTYIKPTFIAMGDTQVEIDQYKEALNNAVAYKQELERLAGVMGDFSTSELRTLERYLPDQVDAIAVMRDIESIIENNRMVLTSIVPVTSGVKSSGRVSAGQSQPTNDQSDSGAELYFEQYSVGVLGTYEQFKLLLQDLERNAYPLEATLITFIPEEGSLYTFNLNLETYALISNTLNE